MENLERIAYQLRKDTLDIIMAGGGGHIGGDMSVMETLVALYFREMNISPENQNDPDRDYFILSKGHSVEAYYAVLCARGFLDLGDVKKRFSKFGSPYIGHPNNKLAGMEMLRAYLLKRSDYSSNLTSGYLDKAFTPITEKDVPDVLREIDSLKPDILLVPATVKVSPEIYQCRLPYTNATDPFAGRLLAEDWIRGVLAPRKEGWRDDVA